MKKLSVISAGLLLAMTAQAEPGPGYFSIGAGRSAWNEDCTGIANCKKNDTAVRVAGGYEVVKGLMSIEGLYLNLGKIKASDAGVAVEVKGQALGIGAALGAEFAPNWRGVARLGVASVKGSASGSGFGVTFNPSKTSTQAYAGLGLSYAFAPSMFVEANFDGTRVKLMDQTESVSAFTIGIGWRF